MGYFIALLLTIQLGQATMFGDTPEDLGGTPACYYRLPRVEYLRKLPRGCAHRTLPCGARVEVLRLHRRHSRIAIGDTSRILHTSCWVVDRGPNGRRRDGRYRGIVDLLPGPAREVRVGKAQVLIWVWPWR